MIDPSIALSGKPVQFDTGNIVNLIAQGQARRMAIESHQQQMQLGAQRIEEGKAAVQKSQVAARDQQITQGAFLSAKGDPNATVQGAINGGASPEAVQALQQHFANIREKNAKATSDELGTRKYQNEQMLGLHEKAIQLAQSDPQAYAQAWPQLYQDAVRIDPKAADHLDPNTPATVPQLTLSEAGYGTDEFYRKQAEAQRQANADTRAQAGEQRASAMAGPQLAKATAEASAATRQNDASVLANAAKQGPDALAAAMFRLPKDRQAPFAGLTGAAKPEDILQLGMTPDQQVTTGQTAAHNKAQEQNAASLLRVSQGRLNIEQQHANIAQKIYDQTYGDGANPALVGVEPKLRTQATTAAQKAADEYTKAMESTANVQTFIDMARSGNKAAGSNLPIMGAESIQALNGIRRINRTEIEQYQGAGSLLDRIQGRIGKLATGQPIPADVMKDIEDLHKAISGNAANNYNAKLGGINQNYRSNFQPVKAQEQAKPAAAPSGHVIELNGKHYRYKGSGATDSMDSYTEVK